MSSNDSAAPGKVLPPAKLAHVVLRTNKLEHMKRFYVTFLGGRIAMEGPTFAFISYDEEHHRIALLEFPGLKDTDFKACGLEHIAFTFPTLRDLCTAYKQRAAHGIRPGWAVNHGPTTSMYYCDPDGNMLETQVDNFDDEEEAQAFIAGPKFAKNPIGADFDPEELCRAVENGEDERVLKKVKDVGPRGPEEIAVKIEYARKMAAVGA